MKGTKTKYYKRQNCNTTTHQYTNPNHIEDFENAVDAIIAFAKSNLKWPTKETVNTVNRFLKPVSGGRKSHPIETIISHRVLMTGQISIKLIRFLTDDQLEKADKTLFDIASNYVHIYKNGLEYIADIHKNGNTHTIHIDPQTAACYRKGLISMDELLNIPNG